MGVKQLLNIKFIILQNRCPCAVFFFLQLRNNFLCSLTILSELMLVAIAFPIIHTGVENYTCLCYVCVVLHSNTVIFLLHRSKALKWSYGPTNRPMSLRSQV